MRDLIGYALYSLVGLVGIVLVFSLFTDAESETQIDQMNNELTSFIAEMRKTHRGHPDLYGTVPIPAATLINSGIAPRTTISGTNVRNSFGGTISVRGVSNTQFAVDYDDVPREVCIQVLSRMRPDPRVDGASVVVAGSTPPNTPIVPFPMSLTLATGACNNNENAIRILAR